MIGDLQIPLQELESSLNAEFHAMGLHDGTCGNKTDKVEDDAAQTAVSFQQVCISQIKGRCAGCTIKQVSLSEEKARVEEEYKKVIDYRDIYNANSRYLPKLFLGKSAWIYGVVGFLLLVADFFISLQLSKKIFSLKPSEEYYGWLIGLGIAMISFYVKIFYDQYIGVSDGVSGMRYNEIYRLSGEKNRWRVNLSIALKGIFHLVLLAAVIALYYFLAFSRLDSLKGKAAMLGSNENARNLFILLNIFIPIIAGICFSLAQKIYLNIAALKGIDAEVDAIKTRLNAANEELKSNEEDRVRLESLLRNWAESPGFKDFYQQDFARNYHRGYREGYANPEAQEDTGRGLLERVEAFRNKMFARKRNNALNDGI